VYRGGFLYASRLDDVYPNIKKKYSRLKGILGDKLDYVQYLARIHHGMPDFFCHRRKETKFVECKLGHEQLSDQQKKCIKVLVLKGFVVEVFKVVFDCTKVREAMVNIYSNEKEILEKQERLKLRW
jgi:hypothetical protein